MSEEFEGNVGVHQRSVLSPLAFAIVVDVVTDDVRNGLMSEMLYADDLVLTSETMEMEGAIQEEGAAGEPREDKSCSEWGRR